MIAYKRLLLTEMGTFETFYELFFLPEWQPYTCHSTSSWVFWSHFKNATFTLEPVLGSFRFILKMPLRHWCCQFS